MKLLVGLTLLKKKGVERVMVSYNGEGDSGGIESVVAVRADETHLDAIPAPLRKALDAWAYGLIDKRHGGYENNEGGFGVITIELKTMKVHHEHNDNITTTETTTHDNELEDTE